MFTPTSISQCRYAPLTSVNTECSFSTYKLVFREKRTHSAQKSRDGACLLLFPKFFHSLLLVKLCAALSMTLHSAKLHKTSVILLDDKLSLLYIGFFVPCLWLWRHKVLSKALYQRILLAPSCAYFRAFCTFFMRLKLDFLLRKHLACNGDVEQ